MNRMAKKRQCTGLEKEKAEVALAARSGPLLPCLPSCPDLICPIENNPWPLNPAGRPELAVWAATRRDAGPAMEPSVTPSPSTYSSSRAWVSL